MRFLNLALVSIWALFLLWLLTYGKGDLVRLLHPRLWWILGAAVTVLILFVISFIISFGHETKRNSLFSELPGTLILLVPVMYFFLAKDARLDATSLQNRIIKDDSGIYLNSLPDSEVFDESISGEMLFSKILREPERYENQDVEIVCQSFVDEKLPDNTSMCYRYFITCCAADALPAFIFLSHSSEVKIKNNLWVRVKGPLSIIRNNDMEFPSVDVDSIEYVKEPAFPWAM